MVVKIEDLQLALALGKAPSLSAAARRLNVTPSALSMRLRKLEGKLGVALATRTARRLSLTPEGEHLAQLAASIVSQLEALPESFQDQAHRLSGTVSVVAPFGYGRHHIAPALARFARLHPDLRIHLDLREAPWHNRHDADVVIHIGAVSDSSWVARRLAQNERWLCASPAYLERRGTPSNPRDLENHDCICIRENEEDMSLWSYRRSGGPAGQTQSKQSVRIRPTHLTNDGSIARQWAEMGLGVVLRSEWDVSDAISRGTLVRLLPEWQFDNAPILLLSPTRQGRSARVTALCDFLVTESSFA